MSWVDLVIAIVVIVATIRGFDSGVLRLVGGLVGFVTGFVVGILLAPALAERIHSGPARALIAIAVVVIATVTGSVLGRLLGGSANRALRRLHLGRVDSVAGALFAAVGSLVACWLVAGLLVNVSFGTISSAIGSSRLLAAVDSVMPPVPAIEAKVAALLRSASFPDVFASVVPTTVTSHPIPGLAVAEGATRGDAASVLKITADGACGYDHEGTAFVVAPGYVVTAAHVVAGATSLEVDGRPATLLVMDTRQDVAVLSTSTGRLAPLRLVSSSPRPGTAAGVLGYPLDGPLTLEPAALDGQISAQGRDIYDEALVTRRLVVLSAAVEPGNSGSPVLTTGEVVAMVFSRSVSQTDVAYAVPASVIRSDIDRARPGGPAVSTGACVAD